MLDFDSGIVLELEQGCALQEVIKRCLLRRPAGEPAAVAVDERQDLLKVFVAESYLLLVAGHDDRFSSSLFPDLVRLVERRFR